VLVIWPRPKVCYFVTLAVPWTRCTDSRRAGAVTQVPSESSHRTRSIAAMTAGSSGLSPSARRAWRSSSSTVCWTRHPAVPFRCIHRLGLGVGIFGIDGMPGIGDMLGLFSIGIFMSFIMEAQQSFDWVAVKGASAFIMWWQSLGCAKMR
jgi:hypothetical protein